MKKAQPTNLVASIHQRLLNHARKSQSEPQLVLMRYAIERLLYRLSQSDYAEEFVMKGALLYLVWTGEQYRSTKDLDLLALKSNAPERLEKVFQELCRVKVVEDGLVFLPDTVRAEEIRENEVYQGEMTSWTKFISACSKAWA